MSVFNWFAGLFTNRGRAMSHYRRGMAKAKKRNHQGAIDDYTKSIEIADARADVTAMALYNRALVYVAAGDDQKGVGDLDALLAMEDAPVNVKTMAKQKLQRMENRSRKSKV